MAWEFEKQDKPLAAWVIEDTPQPADGWRGSWLGGVARGLRDYPDAFAQMASRGVEAAIPDSWTTLDQWAKGQVANVDRINAEAEREYRQDWGRGNDGLDVGRLAGNIVGAAPLAVAAPSGAGLGLAARTGIGAATGAMANALQPVQNPGEDFWQQKGTQAGIGAGFGAAGTMLGSGVARLVRPKTDPGIAKLASEGITPTPGQVLGGTFKSVEERARSLPILGDAITKGQQRAQAQLNVAALNRALFPLGKSLPKAIKIGREAVDYVDDVLSKSYDDAITKIKTPAIDNQFLDDLSNLTQMVRNQPHEMAQRLDRIITNEILDRTEYGRLTGEAIKKAESELGRLAKGLRTSQSADDRVLGEAVFEAQRSLRDWLQRAAPAGVADQLKRTNEAWKNFVRVQYASGMKGADDGVFNASQLQSAVRNLSPGVGGRKPQFARGEAVMQDLSDPAQRVLTSKYPDSGTAGRLMLGAGAAYLEPMSVAALGLPSAAYAPGIQRGLMHLLATRPEGATAVANQIRALSPALGGMLAPSAPMLFE